MSDDCAPDRHHKLRAQYAHLAVGHHADCSCTLCGLRKMAGLVNQAPAPEYRGRWPGQERREAIESMDREPIFSHIDPVWRRLADYLIVFQEDDYEGTAFEQLWAQQTKANQFQICCVPGIAYGLALGDMVETDNLLLVQRVVERSRHSTFRIWSEDGWYEKATVLNEVAARGGLLEVISFSIIAIDVEGDQTWSLWDYLQEMEGLGILKWEQGHWAAGTERPDDRN